MEDINIKIHINIIIYFFIYLFLHLFINLFYFQLHVSVLYPLLDQNYISFIKI
jgi:hypothetical protein